MKMNVVKQVSEDVEIDSKDMGVAFAIVQCILSFSLTEKYVAVDIKGDRI